MFSRILVPASVAMACLILPAAVMAQGDNGGNIDLNSFRPAMDSRGYITVNASQVLGNHELSFGLVTDWGKNLLTFKSGKNVYQVQNIISPTLLGAFGLWLGPLQLEIGGSLPFDVVQGDRNPDYIDSTNPNNNKDFGFDGQGVGDASLSLKVRFLNTSRAPHIGLAVIGSLALPTDSQTNIWLGGNSVTPQVIGVVDKTFGSHFKLALNGGIRLRSGDHTFTDSPISGVTPPPPATNKTITAGTTLPFGLGAAYAVEPQKFEIVGELFGDVPVSGGKDYFPLEALGGLKLYLARNSFLSFGGGVGLLHNEGGSPDYRAFLGIVFEPNLGDRDGDGIPDDIDKCPDDPEDKDGFQDADGCPDPDNDRDGVLDVDDQCPNIPGPASNHGCPVTGVADRDHDGIPDKIDKCPDQPEDFDGFQDKDGCPDLDNDHDGILDKNDLCPNQPEDFDGFQDKDGCPDPDNDHDRILDKDDKCPNQPETYNGYQDADGCPDHGITVVTNTHINILKKIHFAFNSAKIQPRSDKILDAVVATLQGNPDILKVEIQGHTDERGSASYNLALSQRRANSVKKYLVDHGVDPSRLTAQGYGETKPLDPHHNPRAWAKNRRVEFLILKRAAH